MSAYKDQARGTWTAQVSYKDWKGIQKHTCKRGFATKREALQWEQEYLNKVRDRTDMLFRDYAEVYLRNRENRIREGTMQTKTNIMPICSRMYKIQWLIDSAKLRRIVLTKKRRIRDGKEY